MATMYGKQFEMLMAEVCRDFGAKLVKSWDTSASKSEVRDFVEEAVATFFKVAEPEPEESVVVSPKAKKAKAKKESWASECEEEEETVMSPPKAKAKRAVVKGKGKGKVTEVAVVVSPKPVAKGKAKAKVVGEEEKEERATDIPVAKGKAKGKAKPKCEALTAKGTRCSKCAVEGGVFCAVHVKSKEEKPKKEAKKKDEKKEVKHTHGLKSPLKDGEDCELCEMHGEAFEMPEYEVMGSEEGSEAGDPTYELEEEDFEDLD
jgi:hypothetical protein